jgi:hypothetical protein
VSVALVCKMNNDLQSQCYCSDDDSSSSVGGDDVDLYSDQCDEDYGVEAGSVACVYTQLMCVVVFVIWMALAPL